MDRIERKLPPSVLLLFALALFYPTPQGNAVAGEMKRQKAPNFALKLFDGHELKSSDTYGKVVVLKFMASW
jgi:hypothetical protein